MLKYTSSLYLVLLIAMKLNFINCEVGIDDDDIIGELYDEYDDDYEYFDNGGMEIVSEDEFNAVSACYKAKKLRDHDTEIVASEFGIKNKDYFVIFESPILDNNDIAHITTLAECVRLHVESHVEDRQDFDKNGHEGGNTVTYIGGFFQRLLPDILTRLTNIFDIAAEKAGWKLLPNQLSIRGIEELRCGAGGEPIPHEDTDSIYTISILLSDTSEFSGGEMLFQPISGDISSSIVIQPGEKGTGVIFDSLVDHAVNRVVSGERIVLAIELWPREEGDFELRADATEFELLPNMIDRFEQMEQEL
eukprot:CAMPEP_0182429090 /NCGR_PEP_ID=MMETSP1167-20130531/25510_1 /TAXON_ID=2988 /ORGANISM="Mallomonas Sp, Strain CCMP3275" /LENGTH=304 /DNA_ID=CAMNT_0024612421 /DNA_START=104 /DNA_END=1018 /DNA_ORIENTATION=+